MLFRPLAASPTLVSFLMSRVAHVSKCLHVSNQRASANEAKDIREALMA